MVNDVSAPSGVSSNDLMMIHDSVFLFLGHPVLIIIITKSLVNTHILFNYKILILNYIFI